ncbi:hypothetical protein D8I24_4819 [Cupriavidus necator H850]|nr:hypothetical protein D8I24_4819 [Cupriavidus necator H850]
MRGDRAHHREQFPGGVPLNASTPLRFQQDPCRALRGAMHQAVARHAPSQRNPRRNAAIPVQNPWPGTCITSGKSRSVHHPRGASQTHAGWPGIALEVRAPRHRAGWHRRPQERVVPACVAMGGLPVPARGQSLTRIAQGTP